MIPERQAASRRSAHATRPSVTNTALRVRRPADAMTPLHIPRAKVRALKSRRPSASLRALGAPPPHTHRTRNPTMERRAARLTSSARRAVVGFLLRCIAYWGVALLVVSRIPAVDQGGIALTVRSLQVVL